MNPTTPPAPVPALITKGTCHVLFAFDLGFAIDLDHAQRLLATEGAERLALRHGRKAPRSFQYEPPPLRILRAVPTVTVGDRQTLPTMEAVLFDFGAASLTFTIPLEGPFAGLLRLSEQLYENAALLKAAREQIESLLAALGPAVAKPGPATIVEDYIVFQVESMGGGPDGGIDHGAWVNANSDLLARILRSEAGSLSEQERNDALSCRLSYAASDAAIVDWNAAMLFGPDAEDSLAVLEFANVELLEVRFLDGQLDTALDRAHEAAQKPVRGFLTSHAMAMELRRIATFQIDSAHLFEGVNNALKLLGDQYLARLYRMTAGRFHLQEWDGNILRKLATLQSIYDKLSDRKATRRAEILEWIIIALIAFEIVMSLVGVFK